MPFETSQQSSQIDAVLLHTLDPAVAEQKKAPVDQTLELQKNLAQLQALYHMVDVVGRAAAIEDIYEVALDELQRTVRADRASVLLVDPDRVMRFKASRGLSEEYRKAVEGHTPWSLDDPNPQPILVPDILADPALSEYVPVFEKEGLRALGFIPLVDSGKLLGKFMIYFNTPHIVLNEEVRLAKTIASHIAFAITRKKSEEEIIEAAKTQRLLAEEAQEANLAKSQFLTMMSHELRTPLNAIGGYAELLEMGLHGTLNEEQLQDVTRIQRSQRHLLGLINDLLNFARIETGHIELRDEVVSIEESIVEVEVLLAPQITAKKLEYKRERSANGITCRGDHEKIGQVLLNLASNAVKFTPPGRDVVINWETGPAWVKITVTATGPGIPEGKLQAIFEPFVQLRQDVSRMTEGTGLGLAISRQLARAMGGDVTVVSEFGAGS